MPNEEPISELWRFTPCKECKYMNKATWEEPCVSCSGHSNFERKEEFNEKRENSSDYLKK